MIFDSHCHYNLAPLKQQWREHWQQAQEHQVKAAIVVGTSYESSTTALAIAAEEPQLFATLGNHPNNYHQHAKEWLDSKWGDESDLDGIVLNDIRHLELLLPNSHQSDQADDEAATEPQVVAIGETGLDYFRLPDSGKERSVTIALQQEALIAHLELASRYELPLILHVRDRSTTAYYDLLEILREHLNDPIGFVLHCLSGPADYLKQALDLGAYVGLAGNLTYPSAGQLRDMAQLVPADRLLLETDAPYLPPQDWRGQTCEPWMIAQTAQFLQEELEIDPDTCWENATRLFALST